jgi:hypothetical protein
MAHRPRDYARRARRRFCAGSRKAPIELVLSGQRTLEEWIETLSQERAVKARPPLPASGVTRDTASRVKP